MVNKVYQCKTVTKTMAESLRRIGSCKVVRCTSVKNTLFHIKETSPLTKNFAGYNTYIKT